MVESDDEINLLLGKLREMDPGRRAYIVIKEFLSAGDRTKELEDRFYSWFYCEDGFEERLNAYEKVVDDILREYLDIDITDTDDDVNSQHP